MPLALLVALAGSLALHLGALFGPEIELFSPASPSPRLLAELRPLPVATEGAVAIMSPPAPHQERSRKKRSGPPHPRQVMPIAEVQTAATGTEMEAGAEPVADEVAAPTVAPPQPPARPVLPSEGVIRYAITKVSLGIQIGRAEHRWAFPGDGSYHLLGISETSGLVSVFKPLRIENESHGRLVPGGLQPERFVTRRNGVGTDENAEFDWSTGQVRLARDASVHEVAAGAQDVLSLNYQLAFLGRLAEGASVGVVTGRKYERYALDALGEEEIDTPAGRFRTLHLRAISGTVTEIWIALDHQRLPVKIRFTDKKGDVYEQVVTEIGVERLPPT